MCHTFAPLQVAEQTSFICAGEAKVHDCLRQNMDKISDACRKEEISLSVLQASNTELMPNIANACKVILPRNSAVAAVAHVVLRGSTSIIVMLHDAVTWLAWQSTHDIITKHKDIAMQVYKCESWPVQQTLTSYKVLHRMQQ